MRISVKLLTKYVIMIYPLLAVHVRRLNQSRPKVDPKSKCLAGLGGKNG